MADLRGSHFVPVHYRAHLQLPQPWQRRHRRRVRRRHQPRGRHLHPQLQQLRPEALQHAPQRWRVLESTSTAAAAAPGRAGPPCPQPYATKVQVQGLAHGQCKRMTASVRRAAPRVARGGRRSCAGRGTPFVHRHRPPLLRQSSGARAPELLARACSRTAAASLCCRTCRAVRTCFPAVRSTVWLLLRVLVVLRHRDGHVVQAQGLDGGRQKAQVYGCGRVTVVRQLQAGQVRQVRR